MCGLSEGTHWYVDHQAAPYLYQIGTSPEQAERNLRSWAAKVVRTGHLYMDIRSVAGRVLATRIIHMIQVCEDPAELAKLHDCCTID